MASGLLSEEQLDEARRSIRWSGGDEPDADRPPSDQQLADRLVEMGKLNAWQAKQLLDGRTKFNLGPYWIVDSLGQGGMGQVFKAEHSVLGRTVAVKVLPRHKSTPEAIANFQNEIRALARLDHDKLVRAVDAGHDGNVHFLVTEYVPGCDLRKLVRRDGPLSMERAAAIVYQVAEGLHHAHGQGLIHRDVKPGNVLVTPEGEAKLSDLGLAGPHDEDVEKDPRFGKIVGTADYVAPDHVQSPWNPTPLWDVYSLGCTLYYAVTGKVPFPGGSTADKARAHCELRPLDPRRLNPNLSPEFVDVLADMMAKDPAQRIASAAGVMRRLEPWARGALPSKPVSAEPTAAWPSAAGPPVAAPPVVARPIPIPRGAAGLPGVVPVCPPMAAPPTLATPPAARSFAGAPAGGAAKGGSGAGLRPVRSAPLREPIRPAPPAPTTPAGPAGATPGAHIADTAAGLPETLGDSDGGSQDSASLELQPADPAAVQNAAAAEPSSPEPRSASRLLPIVLLLLAILVPLLLGFVALAVWLAITYAG